MGDFEKIVLIGPYPPPYGGISVHVKNLYAYLRNETSRPTRLMYLSKEPGRHTTVSPSERLFETNKALFVSLLREIKCIYHVHASGIQTFRRVLTVILAGVVTGSKVILTIHSGGFPTEINRLGGRTRRAAKAALRRVDHFICVNGEILAGVQALGIPSTKCEVIPAFSIDWDMSGVQVPEEILRFFEHHHPVVCAMGYTYEDHYGFVSAVKAVDALAGTFNRIGLIIAGPRERDGHYDRFVLASGSSLRSNVLLAGEVDYLTSLAILKRSSVFLRPTLFDGDALSIREALALRIPVVASDTGERPPGPVLFPPGDFAAMLSELERSLRKGPRQQEAGSIRDLENLERVNRVYDVCRERTVLGVSG